MKLGQDDLFKFASCLNAGGDPFVHWKAMYRACGVRHAAYGFFAMRCEALRPDCSKTFFWQSSFADAGQSVGNFGLASGGNPVIAQVTEHLARLAIQPERAGAPQRPIRLERANPPLADGDVLARNGFFVPLHNGQNGLSAMAFWLDYPSGSGGFSGWWRQNGAYLVHLGQMLDSYLRNQNPNLMVGLTAREVDCLRFLLAGYRPAEMCFLQDISPKTFEKHILSARLKLRAHTRDQALAKAVVLGVLRP